MAAETLRRYRLRFRIGALRGRDMCPYREGTSCEGPGSQHFGWCSSAVAASTPRTSQGAGTRSVTTRSPSCAATSSRNGVAGEVASFDIDVRRLRAIDNVREVVRLARFRGGDGRIVDSVVVRNDRLGQGFDIAAAGRLRLVRTQCGRSAKLRYRRHPETNGYRPRV